MKKNVSPILQTVIVPYKIVIKQLVEKMHIYMHELQFSYNNLCWFELLLWSITLRKHAYSNILKMLPPKTESFLIKSSDIFHISAQNIDCGYSLELPRWGRSNEYPQSMFWAEIRKIMYTPVNPSFTI